MSLKLPVNVANLVAKNFSKIMIRVTLTKRVPGVRSSTAPSQGAPLSTATFVGKGFVEDYEENRIDGDSIRVGDRRIMILANTMKGVTPNPQDIVNIEGRSYHVISVKRDPADATWSMQARGEA